MISSSSRRNERLMAAKTSSLDVCLAGENSAASLQRRMTDYTRADPDFYG